MPGTIFPNWLDRKDSFRVGGMAASFVFKLPRKTTVLVDTGGGNFKTRVRTSEWTPLASMIKSKY